MTTKKTRGRPKLPEDQKKNYKNQTYSRMAVWPETHKAIRKKSLRAGKLIVEWLDETVQNAKS